MRQSVYFGRTIKESPKEAQTAANKLLLRGGYIRQVSSGVFAYLPLLTRTLARLDGIIRFEMHKCGAGELIAPLLQPMELLREAGLGEGPDETDFELKDRRGGSIVLNAESAALFAALAGKDIGSHKDLPKIVFRIHTGFRNDIRPRHGLAGSREFPVHSAFSLDMDETGQKASFEKIQQAFRRIIDTLGLEYRMVEAGDGFEIMAVSEVREDGFVHCDRCDYAGALDWAESRIEEYPQDAEKESMEAVHGPGLIGVEPLAEFLKTPVWKTTKAILFQADDDVVCVLVRGDCDVNETKVKNHLKCRNLSLAAPQVISDLTGAEVGYAGPIGLPRQIKVIADRYVDNRINFECGANRTDYHYINVNFERDFPRPVFGDFKMAADGHLCPRCDGGGLMKAFGVKIGQAASLGTDLSTKTGCTFLDKAGRPQPVFMADYSLNLARVISTAVDQHHDDSGIVWPRSIAPHQVHLIGLNLEKEEIAEEAESIYQRLLRENTDVLYDDRLIRAGEKFTDADLIGAPVRITVSKRTVREKKLEFKSRDREDKEMLEYEEAFQRVNTTE